MGMGVGGRVGEGVKNRWLLKCLLSCGRCLGESRDGGGLVSRLIGEGC